MVKARVIVEREPDKERFIRRAETMSPEMFS